MEPHLELPLLKRAQEGDYAFALTTEPPLEASEIGSFCGAPSAATSIPLPLPGEQYRFHFDMTKCIGCKCCVVACNEQNGNPADILWRRVGEIEGGAYPNTLRHYLSMGCNHCLEPTCMTGCPVNAYSKDSLTGIVRHSADACIGCQYCTWNCSYGVPQYNPDRGVVGKCDMCYGRLLIGQEPACVAACPEGAIRIETVRGDEWRDQYRSKANAPGMPSADDSVSTTRITLPAILPEDVRKVDLSHLRVEHPHWPLIVMTVLTQLSVGGFVSIWLRQVFGAHTHRLAALLTLFVALLALVASTLHLGRPIHAVRALKMWRRSWLSREVLLFTLFTGAATVYSAALWLGARQASVLGALTAILGVFGVAASARLYLVPGRPAWNSPFTILEFLATSALLGSSVAEILAGTASDAASILLFAVTLTVVISVSKVTWLALSSVQELHKTWQLLSTVLSRQVSARFVSLGVGALCALSQHRLVIIAAALLILAGEFTSRYLFFVSVVPTNMAAGYLAQEAA
jgi:DMSO reductase iron-sulfur subunit